MIRFKLSDEDKRVAGLCMRQARHRLRDVETGEVATLRDIATACERSFGLISHYETGRVYPSEAMLVKLAAAYQVPEQQMRLWWGMPSAEDSEWLQKTWSNKMTRELEERYGS